MTTKYKASQPSWMKLCLLFMTLTFLSQSMAQIVTGEENKEEEKKEEKEKKEKPPKEPVNRDSLSGTTYYLTGLFEYGHRRFQDNSLGQSYSHLNELTPDYTGGFSLGVIFPIKMDFSLDIGFSFFGHKEQFNYADPDSDSTYHYSNNYMQIAMPIKLRYTYGEKLQIFGFAGLTPVNVLNIRFREDFNRVEGGFVERDVEVIKNAKLNIFNLIGNVGFGFTYNFDWVGITIYPEYRHYFMNTYNDQLPYDHKMYALGVNAGFTLRF